ncbi:MAG: polyhydroxyalkanoic acid system family protein [Deltaproteobacteria bacterium]|nr:polyhydroxyalkanoic acid system family protein [Deltaproteobacteria bacterium]
MADISLQRNHSFGIDSGKEKLARLVSKFQQSNPSLIDRIDWNADKTAAEAEGKHFKAQFALTTAQVKVDIDLKGFAAKMAKGMVQTKLEKTVGEEFPA